MDSNRRCTYEDSDVAATKRSPRHKHQNTGITPPPGYTKNSGSPTPGYSPPPSYNSHYSYDSFFQENRVQVSLTYSPNKRFSSTFLQIISLYVCEPIYQGRHQNRRSVLGIGGVKSAGSVELSLQLRKP